MDTYLVKNLQTGEILFQNVKKADCFWSKFLGLMGKKELNGYDGLWLYKVSSIHCFFMRFAIDAVYLDKNYMVLEQELMKPWSIGKFIKGAKHVLELGKGQGTKVAVGMHLVFEKNSRG